MSRIRKGAPLGLQSRGINAFPLLVLLVLLAHRNVPFLVSINLGNQWHSKRGKNAKPCKSELFCSYQTKGIVQSCS
ncbi:hypothetical protein F5Y06DRAFT_211235 [Hypoxylon sp. FL0890]|nr:hypothetical protein F5Y06DRAFT_211235 [Hypoxylon sp. FL0890]